ncbi:AdoMet-dependent rRNA methyltransferase spb1 [Chytridiales sp. JEL 0842]|nr:AdoMet-dependent rRNA methyltransferase spb1 [Chytridiales sp. JEL 0842]
MGIKKKDAKGRLDKFYYMAKEQGYRARSAFKLIQINKKFNFLEKSKVVVDLCAAPGGWLQVAQKYMPRQSIIIGIDLAPIKPIPGVITHVEDITTAKCRNTLKAELKTWKVDVFLHDGAPNVGTAWLQDAFQQSELVLHSLKLAVEFLVPGGTFVTKVFRSKDYNKLLWVFNQLFRKVEATKPSSSRNVSAEIFVVCQDFLAPKKIDPKMLDPKFVFKEVDDFVEEEDEKQKKERQSAILNDLFHPEKKRRHRDGYADGASVLHVVTPASEFITGSDFVSILARSNALDFKDEIGKQVLKSPFTTEDIKTFVQDLRVLGKKDFKDLIKWRESVRIAMGLEKSPEEKKKEAAEREEARKAEEAAKANTEESVVDDLTRQAESLQAQQKRDKRKARERKSKQLLRLRMGMEAPMDIGMEAEMGSIDSLQFDNGTLFDSKPASKSKMSTEFTPSSDDDSEAEGSENDDESEVYDSEDEIAMKLDSLETDVDMMYDQYQQRVLERDPKARVKRQKEGAEAFEEWYGVEWEKKMKGVEEKGEAAAGKGSDSESDFSSEEDDDESEDEEDGGFEVDEKPQARKRKAKVEDEVQDERDGTLTSAVLSKKARLFFDNPLFKGVNESGTGGLFDSEMGGVDTMASDDSDDEEAIRKAAKEAKKKKAAKKKGKEGAEDDSDSEAENKKGFEVVKAASDVKADDASNDFIIDTAQKYTLAQMVIHKSGKRDLIDDGFNRYAFNDPEGLPSWFTEEENRHNKPQLPVTKEAVNIMRAKLRAMDARPIKKVAEAKFRKKMRADARLHKALKKASAVADDPDAPDKSKLRDAAKIMKKALSKKQDKKPELVVAKNQNKGLKGRPKGVKGRYKMVDGVMKKELKQQKARNKRAKKHSNTRRR